MVFMFFLLFELIKYQESFFYFQVNCLGKRVNGVLFFFFFLFCVCLFCGGGTLGLDLMGNRISIQDIGTI